MTNIIYKITKQSTQQNKRMPIQRLAFEDPSSPELPSRQLHRVCRYRHVVAGGERHHGPCQPIHRQVTLVRPHERGVVDPHRGGHGGALEEPPPSLVHTPGRGHGDGHGPVLTNCSIAHTLLVGLSCQQQLPHTDVDVQAHNALPPGGGPDGGS